MACNDAAGLVNQDGVGKAEFLDAGSDLGYLSIGMGAAVPGIRNQRVELYLLNFHKSIRGLWLRPRAAVPGHNASGGGVLQRGGRARGESRK